MGIHLLFSQHRGLPGGAGLPPGSFTWSSQGLWGQQVPPKPEYGTVTQKPCHGESPSRGPPAPTRPELVSWEHTQTPLLSPTPGQHHLPQPCQPAQHHLLSIGPSYGEDPRGQPATHRGPKLRWGSPGPVADGSLQEEPPGDPRPQLCRQRLGQMLGLAWTEAAVALAPQPNWLPGG